MFCKYCGSTIDKDFVVCPHCGRQLSTIRYESGQSEFVNQREELPEHIARQFNWGGFGLSWIWAIGNQTWIGLLALIVPFPIMNIILGLKGNGWAWQNGEWRSVEHFQKTQKSWALWGIIYLVFSAMMIVATIIVIALIFSGSFFIDLHI